MSKNESVNGLFVIWKHRGILYKEIYKMSNTPKTFYLAGSNDGNNWSLIDSETLASYNSNFNSYASTSNTTQYYQYLRLIISNNFGGANVQVVDWQIFGNVSVQVTDSAGVTGEFGFTGLMGALGFTGWVGATGFTGESGFTGRTGPTGFTGMTGPISATGWTGRTGATGWRGNTGPTGALIGFTGPVGPSPMNVGGGGTGGGGSTGTVDTTLILYYPFDTDVLNYASGVGVAFGSIVGGTVSRNTSVYVIGTGSLYQSASNNSSYFQCGSLAANSNGYSFSFWLNMTSYTAGIVFGFSNQLYAQTDVGRISLWNTGTQMRFVCGGTGGLFISRPPLNTWTHYAWTLDKNNNNNLYVNGSLLSGYPNTSVTYSSFAMNYNWIMGDTYNSTAANVGQQGYVDEFRYYNRILSAVEVASLYYVPTNASLILYYPFDTDLLNYASGVGVANGSIVGSTVSRNTSVYKFGTGSLLQSASNASSYFSIPTIPTNNAGYSFSMWINLQSRTPHGIVFTFSNALTQDLNRIFIWNNTNVFEFSFNNQRQNVPLPSLGVWTHYAWTINTSGNAIIYINGVSTYTYNITYIQMIFVYNWIFGDTWIGGYGMRGYVDEFRY